MTLGGYFTEVGRMCVLCSNARGSAFWLQDMEFTSRRCSPLGHRRLYSVVRIGQNERMGNVEVRSLVVGTDDDGIRCAFVYGHKGFSVWDTNWL